MPKFNKEIKKGLLYILALLLAFIGGLVGLDQLNSTLDKDLNDYKKDYETAKKIYEENQKQTTQTNN